MESDPVLRFSSRVSDYVRYRPSYPPEIPAFLARECGLQPESTVADIGSGTGLLAGLFLDFGCRVIGVEPNFEMRQAGERLLANFPRFRSINARAENTGLPVASVDFITAGQSFHWFDAEPTRHEFLRIAKPPGWVVLVWNEREVEGPFLEKYEALLQEYSPDYAKVDHRRVGDEALDAFFGKGRWALANFANTQVFDLEGLLGRLRSSSYAPSPGEPRYDVLIREVTALFHDRSEGGKVVIRYRAKVFYGTIAAERK